MANTNLNTTSTIFATASNQDTTFRVLGTGYLTPASGLSQISGATYAASIQPNDYHTIINFGSVTAATTSLTIATASPQIGMQLDVLAQGTATCSLVFDTNVFNVSGGNTISLSANKSTKGAFVYNGYNWLGSITTA